MFNAKDSLVAQQHQRDLRRRADEKRQYQAYRVQRSRERQSETVNRWSRFLSLFL